MKSVLFVEDEESLRVLYKRFMGALLPDCSVPMAGDGDAAWKMMQESHFDVVVTDMNMPGIDGRTLFLLAQKKHSAEQGYRMPGFVFCSGVGTTLEDVSRICADYNCLAMEKPFSLFHLAEAISSLMPASGVAA